MKKLLISGLSLAILLSLSGCLKSREQLREDAPDDTTPAVVTNVTPKPVDSGGQYAIDEIKSELTRLDGRISDLEHAQQQAATSTSGSGDELKNLEKRVTDLENAQANILEAVNKLQNQAPPPADASKLFKKGVHEFGHENWDGAIQALTQYLQTPKAKKAQDAYWMRGESYYHLEKYKLAIADYSEFPEKYTKSRHMAEALYKIGQSFEAIGSPSDAKGFYQLLVDKFPRSAYARKVKSKLK